MAQWGKLAMQATFIKKQYLQIIYNNFAQSIHGKRIVITAIAVCDNQKQIHISNDFKQKVQSNHNYAGELSYHL